VEGAVKQRVVAKNSSASIGRGGEKPRKRQDHGEKRSGGAEGADAATPQGEKKGLKMKEDPQFRAVPDKEEGERKKE